MTGRDDILRAVEGAEILAFPRAKRAQDAADVSSAGRRHNADGEAGSDATETPKAADLLSSASDDARASAPAAAPLAAAAG
ncbi:MAG: hypothetical protein QM651_19360, partial [Rhodoblastus sp.]